MVNESRIPTEDEEEKMVSGDTSVKFSNLPCELQEMIFSYLSFEDMCNVQYVCPEWCKIARGMAQMKRMVIEGRTLPLQKAKEFLRKASSVLKELSLVLRPDVNSILETVSSESPNLEVLSVKRCKLFSKTMELLARNCSGIRSVNLVHCEFKGNLWMELSRFNNLRTLRIDNILGMSRFSSIPGGFNLLTKLELVVFPCNDKDHCRVLDALKDQLQALSTGNFYLTDVFYSFLGKCHELTELDVFSAFKMSDRGFLEGPGRLIKLRCLQINDAIWVTSTAMATFLSDSRAVGQLRKLDLSNCRQLNDSCLAAVAEKCKMLTHLVLRHCPRITNRGLQEVIHGCENLKELDVTDSIGIVSESLRFVPNRLPKLLFLHNCQK